MVPESSEEDNEEKGDPSINYSAQTEISKDEHNARWKRILLLIVAITVHNIPEGNFP